MFLRIAMTLIFACPAVASVSATSSETPLEILASPHYQMTFNKAQKVATLLYSAVLHRRPDDGGLITWMHRIFFSAYSSLPQMAGHMARSQEFQKEVYPNHSAEKIFTHLYETLLGRKPTLAERNDYEYLVVANATDKLVEIIVGSQEFYKAHLQN